jgi:hypothetical protein
VAENDETAGRRPVVLSGVEDTEAAFPEHQFLPVCVLPGLLDPQAAPGSRYGGVRERVRQQIAATFAKRIERYPNRVLVVLGAREPENLQARLYPALEDNRIIDLDLVIVQRPGSKPIPGPESAAVRLHIWEDTAESFLEALIEAGTPLAGQPVGWTIRVKTGKGKTTGVRVSPDAIQKVLDQFVLISEDDLRPPKTFTMDDLTAFLAGTPTAWTGYAAGLPVPRNYETSRGQSLPGELLDALAELEEAEPNKSVESISPPRAKTMTIPCTGGSGATTLLRAAAFQAAGEGYPALLVRPGVTDIDMEVLAGFATALSELTLKQGVANMPPLAIVWDSDASDLRTARHHARQLAATLAAQGRATVVLRAARVGDNAFNDCLSMLQAESSPEEARKCEETFRNLVQRWSLPIDPLPTVDEWLAYEEHSRWITPTGTDTSGSLFWVALRFFLTGGLPRGAAESVRDALSRWIATRDEKVTDEGMRKVLRWVAALSSQRIICPLTVALRPITGGTFSSSIVPILQQMADLVDWQDYSRNLGDFTVRFRHPALAEEYLRGYISGVNQQTAI